MSTRKHDVLRFLTDPNVPFTNNVAEQDGRMMKLRQKSPAAFAPSMARRISPSSAWFSRRPESKVECAADLGRYPARLMTDIRLA